MQSRQEPTTLGLSESSHEILRRLKEDEYFGEMQDAYRFAIAYAARIQPNIDEIPPVRSPRTIFNVGTLDPDRRIRVLISLVLGVQEGKIYETAEKLAEYGIQSIGAHLESGTLNLSDMVAELSDAKAADK